MRSYTVTKALPITHCVELINWQEFGAAALNKDNKAFILHVISLAIGFEISIHLFWVVQITLLISDEAFITVTTEYSNFADIFLLKSAAELSKHTEINNYPIELIDSKQLSYRPMYSLKLVELETLKTYLETNLANSFIRPSKFSAGAPILFV